MKPLKDLTYKKLALYFMMIIVCIFSLIFVYHNEQFYNRTIAKVIETKIEKTVDVTDRYNNRDRLTTQQITAEIKNGEHKDRYIQLTNQYSITGAYDYNFQKGAEVFVQIDQNRSDSHLTGHITDVKRDKYLVIMAWVFIFVLLLVGKIQGIYASVSLAINILLISYCLDIYIKTNTNLLWICAIAVIIFTVLSLLLVNGFNEKAFAAIVATLVGTFSALLITFVTMKLTNERGLSYEEMQFITRPYRMIFLAGLFIGSLGAVMDVAISISATIFELFEKNPMISIKKLKASGMEVGRNIMGTMTNILFFAYISGSIPMLILYLKNLSPLGFTLSMNLSLELARALAGGIGIVITIPIALYTSIFFVKQKRLKL